MFKTKNKKNQRGVSLFLITIMISVLVAFSLNVATIIVESAKLTSNAGDSVKAFHCADSGIEYGLYQISQGLITCTSTPGTDFNGSVNSDSNYTFDGTIINPNNDCGVGTNVTTLGNFNGSVRKVQIQY